MKTNFILILAIVSGFSFGQNYNAFETFPLQENNIWGFGHIGPAFTISRILDSTVTYDDSLSYYILKSEYLGQTYYSFLRLRSDNFYVKRMPDSYPAPNHEYKYYLKGCNIGDEWSQPNPDNIEDTVFTTVLDTFSTTIFDTTVKEILLNKVSDWGTIGQIWTDEWGIIIEEDILDIRFFLISCVIDGIAYGDTTGLTDIAVENTLEDYRLDQNYPNPYNPTTTIGYQLPQSGFVSLKVFDILGREAAVLINQWEPSGYHSIDFNAEDLSSGIYFYRLRVNDFISTKKMLLIK